MEKKTCAHQKCKCAVDEAKAIKKEGKAYCSNECATGKGCSHPGCNCRK